jgi:hypothetical protein
MIVAKPIRKGEFWILQQDGKKVGNVEATGSGFQVLMHNSTAQVPNMKILKNFIEFEPAVTKASRNSTLIHGYQAQGRAYNGIWNVRHRLPLYTKTPKSKSWFAAGWYRVRRRATWQVVRDPKLITLERYPYAGPFHTEQEAQP